VQVLARKEELRKIATRVRRCRKCHLARSRTHAVPGDGAASAKIVFVGEAPGKSEDEQGRPFVGYAGRILEEAMEMAGLKRDKVFITSVLKCRPPKNRNPKTDEIEACLPHLERQIGTISPKVLVALGRFGAKGLTGFMQKIAELRGKKLDRDGVPIVVTYHPAAIIYNRSLQEEIVKDLKRAKRLASK
jgi:DNA polymerase